MQNAPHTTDEVDTKEQLMHRIREWIKLDQDIRSLRALQRERAAAKDAITKELLHVMQTNQIDEFNTNEVQFKYVQRKSKQTLSHKYLSAALTEYFKDPMKATEITEFIDSNREVTTVDRLQTRRLTKAQP